jgi:hypothetical protein
MSRNSAHGARLPRPVRTDPMYLTPEQVGALAEAAGPYQPIILTLAFTGLRFGELAALKAAYCVVGRGLDHHFDCVCDSIVTAGDARSGGAESESSSH